MDVITLSKIVPFFNKLIPPRFNALVDGLFSIFIIAFFLVNRNLSKKVNEVEKIKTDLNELTLEVNTICNKVDNLTQLLEIHTQSLRSFDKSLDEKLSFFMSFILKNIKT